MSLPEQLLYTLFRGRPYTYRKTQCHACNGSGFTWPRVYLDLPRRKHRELPRP